MICYMCSTATIQTKERIKRQIGFHQMKNTCTDKKILNRIKKQATECKNMFNSYSSYRGLIHAVYNELKK